MCDMGEGEWPEYLLQMEAAAARAPLKVPRPAPDRVLEKREEPVPVAVEAST